MLTKKQQVVETLNRLARGMARPDESAQLARAKPTDLAKLGEYLAQCHPELARRLRQLPIGTDARLNAAVAIVLDAAAQAEPAGGGGDPGTPAVSSSVRERLAAATPARADTSDIGEPRVKRPPAAMPERLGEFRVLRVLGEGGMGTVYAARDERLGRLVAVKVLKPDLVERPTSRARFLREARAAARLTHDYVCPVYQVGEADGVAFIVMPLLAGEALDARLRQGRPPLPEALEIARQVALGLDAAHRAGLIHRDVKPSNVWIEARDGQTGRVRLLDFGLARGEGDPEVSTADGSILGTPAYIAPEQIEGRESGPSADMWSLGVMLYELTTGRRPFTGRTSLAVLSAVLTSDPPPACDVEPSLSEDLSAVIAKLMSRDPARRPTDARAVADALAVLARRARRAAQLPTLLEVPAAREAAGTPWLAIAVGAGVALVGALAAALLFR